MQSFMTKISRELRKLAVMADYLAWLLLDPSKFTIIDKSKIKKILIIHLGAIGEVIASTPIIPALKKSLKAQISYMVSPGKEIILENNPCIDEILTYQDDFWKTVETLKKEKFDIVFIVYPSSQKLTLACLLAGIRYRIGGFKAIKSVINLFLTRKMLDFRKKHAVHCNLDIIRIIGIDNKNPRLELYTSKKDQDNAGKLLKKLKIKDYVIIHPGFSFSTKTKYPSRFWPAERYAEVANYLIDKYKVKVLLDGSKEEKVFSEEIIRKTPKYKQNIFVINGIGIGELMALIAKAKLIIAPSTGVVHIAAAFSTSIVQLSGQESYYHWHPWTSEKNYKMIQHSEVCTECEKTYCRKKTIECMMAIKPEEVIKAAEHFLGKKK